jgi:hypothetical protein
MKTKQNVRDSSFSRRKVLEGAAAVAIVAAASPFAAEGVNPKPVGFDPNEKKGILAMAIWLVLTTNPQFVNDLSSTIATATGLDGNVIKTYLQRVQDSTTTLTVPLKTNADVYNYIRAQFYDLATNGPGYTGPQCPKDYSTIAAIAALGK